MIHFRDYQWLTVQGYTHFEAMINTDDRTRDDVFWMLMLRGVAGGPEWRRVQLWDRLSLRLEVSSFKPKLRDWRDLENLNFWNPGPEDKESFIGPAGLLDVDFHPKGGSTERAHSFLNDAVWRVAARDEGWFTAWLIPDDEYHRGEPETPAEVARFAVGPPNFRLLTRATFAGGTVELTRRAAADPLAAARQSLVEQIACESVSKPAVNWHLRQTPDGAEIGPMPWWRSYVQFNTEE